MVGNICSWCSVDLYGKSLWWSKKNCGFQGYKDEGTSFSFPDGVCCSKPAVIHPRPGTEGHVSCELCLCELWFTKSMALYINTIKMSSFPFSALTDWGIFCHLDMKNYYCSDRNAAIWRSVFEIWECAALRESSYGFSTLPSLQPSLLSHLIFCFLCHKPGSCAS